MNDEHNECLVRMITARKLTKLTAKFSYRTDDQLLHTVHLGLGAGETYFGHYVILTHRPNLTA